MPDAIDVALRAQLFPHELELLGNLKRFPLVVRYRLDLMQLRMPLSIWQQLPYDHRLQLAIAPFDTAVERDALSATLKAGVLHVTAAELMSAVPEPMADYRQLDRVPSDIERALARFRLSINLKQWQGLPELARFGLAKLSRPGHENRRLGPLIDDILASNDRLESEIEDAS